MKLLFCLIISIIIYIPCSQAQDDNTIPLDSLSLCAAKLSVNEVDETVSKYGYKIVSTEKTKFMGKDCDMFTFFKESEGVIEKIYLYKNIKSDPFDLTLKVLYYSLFDKNFQIYKKEVENDKGNIFSGEENTGDCFKRNYEGYTSNYYFSICKTKYPNNPVYVLLIVSNNGAGLLRKK